jgi:hypothetical protein
LLTLIQKGKGPASTEEDQSQTSPKRTRGNSSPDTVDSEAKSRELGAQANLYWKKHSTLVISQRACASSSIELATIDGTESTEDNQADVSVKDALFC